ncbi:MAG: hypothetical protein JSC189_001123 [Candidatus Tokpelaia sp. JSC189]|nr:MAG: hypothetical protein JSC189_001123 [Candidatus Tokpelaia sp. JSC189]
MNDILKAAVGYCFMILSLNAAVAIAILSMGAM